MESPDKKRKKNSEEKNPKMASPEKKRKMTPKSDVAICEYTSAGGQNVCHLAGQFVRALRDRQPELNITSKDVLCVEIAALCHDLGHGPFSHLFDKRFISEAWEKRKSELRNENEDEFDDEYEDEDEVDDEDENEDGKWKHEKGSINMLDHMLKVNAGLKDEFNKKGIMEKEVRYIKELINGPQKDAPKSIPKEKWFLYEIVSNDRNKIDVDKWDYFARDSHMLGIGNNFNHNRLISFSRVIEQQICYRDKEATNLYDMFHIRNLLHQRAYQHKTSNSVEIMLAEALVLADEFIKFKGKDGKHVRMSDTVRDMTAFTLLNDGVIHKIIEFDVEKLEKSKGIHRRDVKKLKKSKEILNRILRRDLYRCVGEKRFAGGKFGKREDVIKDIKAKLKGTPIVSRLDEEDFIVVDVVNLDYGNKDQNPIVNVKFYSKTNPDVAEAIAKEDVSRLLPQTFSEQSVRVYCKNQDDKDACKGMFEEWARKCNEKMRKQKN